MNNSLPNPSRITLYSGLLLLTGLLMYSLLVFIPIATELVNNLERLPESVSFDKGAFYLPGVVLGLAVLIFLAVYESVLRKGLTNQLARVCTGLGVFSVAFIFVLPSISHAMVESILFDKHYQVCDEASHQWLHSRTIVYVANQGVCEKLNSSR